MGASGMASDEMLVARPEADANKTPTSTEKKQPESRPAAMILDMGEASREQGFRINGCR